MKVKTSCLESLALVVLFVGFLCMGLPSITEGQSRIIGSNTGNSVQETRVVKEGVNHFIEDGTLIGFSGDQNLYHSFSEFQLLPGDSAIFRTPLIDGVNLTNFFVQHILARVQSATDIGGTVNASTFYPNARLWIMSPNGITVRTGAKFEVGAGFINLTTAEYLRAGTARYFWSNTAGTSTFSSAPIEAFGFVGTRQAGAGTINFPAGTTLTVDANKTVAFVARGITVGDNVALTSSRAAFEFGTKNTDGEISMVETSLGFYLREKDNNLGNNIFLGNNVNINGGPFGLLRIGATSGPPGSESSPPSFSTPTAGTVYTISTNNVGWSSIATRLATPSLSPNNFSLDAGASRTLTVNLGGRTASTMTIDLTSDNSTVAAPLSTPVTVSPGQSTTSFTVNGVNEGTTTIRAQVRNAQASASATVQVTQLVSGTVPTPPVADVPPPPQTGEGGTVLQDNAGFSPTNPVAAVQTVSQNQTRSESQNQNSTVAVTLFGPQSLALTSGRCAGSKDGQFSSFRQVGRDVTPPQPGRFLSSPIMLEEEPMKASELSLPELTITVGRPNVLTVAPEALAFVAMAEGCG